MADRQETRRSRPAKGGKDRQAAVKASLEEEALAASAAQSARDEDAERLMAKAFAVGVPALGAVGTVAAGFIGGLAPALLTAAGGALVGTIGFIWASLRTLSGEAPLPEGIQAHALASRALAPDRKREALRALKDLELEHSVGKIDEADYKQLSTHYRAVAKAVMREMDEGLAPRREQAELLVKAYLEKRNLAPVEKSAADDAKPAKDDAESGADDTETGSDRAPSPRPAEATRVACGKCGVKNEPDAAFCKKCGTSLAKVKNDCAKCGVTNEEDAEFCKKCGSALGAANEVTEKADASV